MAPHSGPALSLEKRESGLRPGEMSKPRRQREDLSIAGTKPAVWEKTGHLTNSQLTLTSRRLSQNTVYTVDNLRTLAKHGASIGSSGLSVGSEPTSAADMPLNMKKSVTFDRNKSSLINGELVNGTVNGEISSTASEVSSGSGYRDHHHDHMGSARHWYTQPLHLGEKDTPNDEPIGLGTSQLSNSAVRNLSTSSIQDSHSNGMHVESGSSTLLQNNNNYSLPSMDQLEQEYFPLTLGAAYTLSAIDPNKIGTISPPAKGLPKPAVPWKLSKRSRSSSHKARPGSSHSSSSSASRNSIDRMYLMQSEAPAIARSSAVLLSSPFQCELSKLRMERLRIEEEHLLEVKRQEELERIRGPLPKWYELKNSRFHYEAHKNNEILKCSDDWQSLLDYRNELEQASKKFQQHRNSKT